MSNIPITPGTGVSSVATETISGFDYQKIKVFDATAASTNAMKVNADGSITASIYGNVGFSGSPSISGAVTIVGTSIPNGSVSGTVGASIIGAPPVTQSGSWSTSVAGGFANLLAPTASFVSGVTSIITGTTPTSVLASAGTGIKNYVTHIICTNGAAVGTFVDIKDGGGNVLYSGYAAASGGGFSSHIFPPLVGSTAKSVDAQPRAQASIIVAMTGYTA